VSTLDHKLEPEVAEVRRLEVITGTGRRRHFTDDFKARVVAETLVSGAVVSDVARRHGLTPQQVFTWRRQAREAVATTESKTLQFVPAIVETALLSRPTSALPGKRTRHAQRSCASIEVEIEGVSVRIGYGRQDDRGGASSLEGRRILAGTVRVVVVATKPVDFRKGMDGLAALVKEQLKFDPFSGVVFCFRAKRADRVKLIFWDGTGLCLFAKRLEGGKFRWPRIEDGVMRLSAAQLSALIEGLDWARVHARRVVAPEAVQ
jgi:transposase